MLPKSIIQNMPEEIKPKANWIEMLSKNIRSLEYF